MIEVVLCCGVRVEGCFGEMGARGRFAFVGGEVDWGFGCIINPAKPLG